MSAASSVTSLAVWNGSPPRSNSTLSPATASEPLVGKVTRKMVPWASRKFIRPSDRSLLPLSASCGAAGATVSILKPRVAAADTLPAASAAVTDRVCGPCPKASMSSSVRA